MGNGRFTRKRSQVQDLHRPPSLSNSYSAFRNKNGAREGPIAVDMPPGGVPKGAVTWLTKGHVILLPRLLFLVLLFVPSLTWAAFTGKVVRVMDGDTIALMHNGHAERIRLNGIDCPEKGQAFGNWAEEPTSIPSILPSCSYP